jgi:hypothetical protein
VTRTKPQATTVRDDTFTYLVTTTNADNTTVTTTAAVNMLEEYGKAGLGIDQLKNGLVNITIVSGSSGFTDAQKLALENIRKFTPNTNPQVAYVGMKFVPTASATSVKIASSLEELKTASTVLLSSANMLSGQYFEPIPVAAYSGIYWNRIQGKTTKYYQWMDSKGNVLGYTLLTINVV